MARLTKKSTPGLSRGAGTGTSRAKSTGKESPGGDDQKARDLHEKTELLVPEFLFRVITDVRKPSHPDLEAYTRLVGSARLSEIRLIGVGSKAVAALGVQNPIYAGQLGMQVAISPMDGCLLSMVEVNVKLVNRSDDQVFFECELKYLIRYELGSDAGDCSAYPEAVLDAFIFKHGPHHVWSYARETVNSLAQKAGFPGVLIPLMPPMQTNVGI